MLDEPDLCDIYPKTSVLEGEEDDFFAHIRFKKAGNMSSGTPYSCFY